MLHLKLATAPPWVNIVRKSIEKILAYHAWCEQKASTNAITIVRLNSECLDLVTDVLLLAQKELAQF